MDQPGILIVEDNDHLRDLFESYLPQSYRVHTVVDGGEALEIVSDGVDVVLLDRRLPGMSGDAVLDEIHNVASVRVAMVTGVEPDLDIIEMDFDDYITKPVSKTDLITTVEHLLNLKLYDRKITELFGLVQKRALLISEKREADLVDNPEFIWLDERINTLRDEVDSIRDEVCTENECSLIERPPTATSA